MLSVRLGRAARALARAPCRREMRAYQHTHPVGAVASSSATVTLTRRQQSSAALPGISTPLIARPLVAVTTATAALLIALSMCVGDASAKTRESRSESPSVVHHKLAYEHKIRTLSPAARCFRYFATIEMGDAVYMTPRDFVNSLVGGCLQPSNLQIDQYSRVEGPYRDADHMLPVTPGEESLYKELASVIGKDVLISFSDYMFLLSLMNHNPRRFELAFKMFDSDGNGNIDRKEFVAIQTVTAHAAKASSALQATASRSVMHERFFENGRTCLPFREFLEFFTGLRLVVRKFEFTRNSDDGNMSVSSFIELVFANRGIAGTDMENLTKRAQTSLGKTKLTFAEFEMFHLLLQNLDDIHTAISLYSASGRDLHKEDLQRAAAVAGVELSPKMVDIMYILFDTDGDGALSEKEFLKVLSQSAAKQRRSADVSLSRTLGGLVTCMRTLASGDGV